MTKANPSHPALQQLIIATASALDTCAALFHAQEEADRGRKQNESAQRGTAAELERLDAVESWVESAIHPLLPTDKKRPAPGSQSAATAIAVAAKKALRQQRDALETKANANRGRGLSRGVMSLLERYLRMHELPMTRWQIDWAAVGPEQVASATVKAFAPEKLTLEFSSSCEALGRAVKLSTLSVPELSRAKIETFVGELQPNRAPKAKLVGLRGYWLWAVSWQEGSGTMLFSKSAKKPSRLMSVTFSEDTAPPSVVMLDSTGSALGPAAAQAGLAATVLSSLWSSLTPALAELARARTSMYKATLDGQEIERLANPGAAAEAILRAITPSLRNARGNNGATLLPATELRKKFVGLPKRYSDMLDRAGLRDSGSPGSRASDALPVDSLSDAPTLIQNKTEPLFGSETIDEKFNDLDLEVGSTEKTNPGFRRPRRAIA